ncbi:MAG: hypothetical protein E2591_30465 [Achromobacter sp.]|uniref:hypothetical protein n=1 Tax=Achromobacter TaxID=222 RepID=UPI000F8FB2E2|nr:MULTISPECIES: hypothetical protein [Achromobacter]AZS77384.1 hypothetical protein ELS24_02355 [Achromobacter spanius]MPS82391.1 hypothetical protein [Achromobacter sp.]CAB3818714.1 hypothetical protein LMG2828_00341 [Achromobacter piechaudii]
MATLEDIEKCLGQEAAKYATNKNTGGNNGSKGTRYEDFYLTYKLVEVASAIACLRRHDNPHIRGQALGFVDDVRIEEDGATEYFQLKNKASVSWTAGEHPIQTDFSMQHQLSTHLQERAPRTTLVVSSSDLKVSLDASIPKVIEAHTSVCHFPWTVTANRLVLEDPQLQAWLKELAHNPDATKEALCGAFGALMMACINRPEGAHVEELLSDASLFYPGTVRLFPTEKDWQDQLRVDFTKILATIRGLAYSADRGFFRWQAFGTSGIFGSSVMSEEFVKFQDTVVRTAPKTFEDFEGVLP